MNARHRYGVSGEFTDARALIDAVRALRSAGYFDIEAYSPYPVEGLVEAIGASRAHLPFWMLLGGLVGGFGLLALEAWTSMRAYPIDVGGRPLASWPAFIPSALEIALLGAALAGVVAMLRGSRLPRLHHPVFGVAGFERASRDRFFVVVRDADADASTTRRELRRLGALACDEVS